MAEPQDDTMQPLTRVRIFEGLDLEALESVAAAARSVQKEPEANFFVQGQKASKFFVVISGRVKVSQVTPEGHQIVVRYAGAGEMFGCVPLFGGDEYPATATAVTRCKALTWNRAAVDRLTERFPRIAINALELLGKELSGLRARYRELATERVERRIARALLRLVGQAGRKVEDGVLIEFPLSRQDLAELTGTTLHTVSRILSGWEQKGIVRSGRRRIVIRSPHGLVSIAEDLDPQLEDLA
ncbi:MAG TPA: Crp/Fnr family transcriptional regulator [Acidobacteriota bacterium]|nr:Crp/Fnr family transcriptional regulator [Acidobacteriota bacterium]